MSDTLAQPAMALGGASYDGLVRVTELAPQGMITLRGDLASAEMAKALQDVCGLPVPEVRRIETTGGRSVVWMSPDEVLVLTDYATADAECDALKAALSAVSALVVTVSDARVVFELSGAQAREVLAKVAPVDLRADRFGPGQVRRTRLAQIAGAIWFEDDQTARVICFRSVAEYAFSLFKTVAAPGSEVNHF